MPPTSKRPRGRPKHADVLTLAEWRVVQAVRHGLSNRAIAKLRGISLDAVKYHVQNAIAKLQLTDRNALRRWTGLPRHTALAQRLSQRGSFPMNTPCTLGPIGQISRSVRDIERSQEWYGKTLGLPHLYTFGKLAFFDCGGTRLYLQEQAEVTAESILYLRVDDIMSAHAALSARGVEFTGAPHLIHKHADGTEEWMAFFKDLEGRPLALMSQARGRA